jgi:hypothetical protein
MCSRGHRMAMSSKENSFPTYAKSMFQASSSGVKEDSTSLYPDRP